MKLNIFKLHSLKIHLIKLLGKRNIIFSIKMLKNFTKSVFFFFFFATRSLHNKSLILFYILSVNHSLRTTVTWNGEVRVAMSYLFFINKKHFKFPDNLVMFWKLLTF